MDRKAVAEATGGAAIGLPGMMWTADRLGLDVPQGIVWIVGLVSVGFGVSSTVLWYRIARDWLQAQRRPTLGPYILLIASGIGLVAGFVWLVSSTRDRAPVPVLGFNPPWPDAIHCKMTEPQSTIESEFIFLYRGVGTSRSPFGTVIIYYMPGWYNTPSYGYLSHEIWFSERTLSLIRPENVPDDELGELAKRYKTAFPYKVKCGGDTLDEIKRSGNAYFFAQKAQ